MFKAATVARPVGVRPIILLPSSLQQKCSRHHCWCGCNRGMRSSVNGSWASTCAPLNFVTGMAGHAQVFPHRLTASSFRKNVVDYQTCTRDGGQGMTIGTPVAGFGHYTLAQGPGDAPSRHLGLCNSSGEGM